MANARIDENHVKTLMGVSCVDGITPVPITVNPITGEVLVDYAETISYNPQDIAPRDENRQPVWLAQSEVDGTALPINVNPLTGAILCGN